MIDSLYDPPKKVPARVTRKLLILVCFALLVAGCAADRAATPEPASRAPAPAATAAPATPAAPTAAESEARTKTPPPSAAATATGSTTGSTTGKETPSKPGSPATGDAAKASEAGQNGAKKDAPAKDGDAKTGDPKADEKKKDDEKKPGRIVLDTEYDDRRVGEDETESVRAEMGIVDDEALNRYLQSVAVRLLRYAPPRPFDYTFKIVDQTVPNAFALPGGKIFVSRGLLALVETEDELAGVLGHEITHAAERHAAARMEISRRINPLVMGWMRAAQIAAYGRDQERDADRGGQILCARAGYDPGGIATFLRKLDALERYETGWSRLPFFLATHPTSPERSALASDRAASLQWTRVPAISENRPFKYLSVVDGLVLGDDPAGGLFDGPLFVQPEMRFSIRFPEGWQTMNTQQAVAAMSPDGDAQATLSLAGPGEDVEKVVDEFFAKEGQTIHVRVAERRKIMMGELPAVRLEGRGTEQIMTNAGPQQVALYMQMTFVAYDGVVYRLALESIAGSALKYRGRATAFAMSFRPLDEAGAHSLLVKRLRIARALDGETLQDLSTRTRNALELGYTGVMNGIFASTELSGGMPIKIGIAEPYLPRPRPEKKPAPDATKTKKGKTKPAGSAGAKAEKKP